MESATASVLVAEVLALSLIGSSCAYLASPRSSPLTFVISVAIVTCNVSVSGKATCSTCLVAEKVVTVGVEYSMGSLKRGQ